MYLKCIEVQGFKSFANKIKFEFHNGITGIVGPNGSGKSNVADAVRWVLGEQSAKQLRGSSMQDIIFAGTESRKPLGFAYVAITLDNSDHKLQIDYEEVTVARRVYRSGESEYLINGAVCRLKDVHELFYDTGIGKEGYSIIGQGQIEKILSGKPEDRRELFDEAVGIVKFKRRKNETIKKLEEERANLERVSDILSELEIQVGPLKEQSAKAKVFLQKKEELKTFDVNMFLLEDRRIKSEIKSLENNIGIAGKQLESTKAEYDSTKAEYDALEAKIEENDSRIDSNREKLNESTLLKEKNESKISLLNEQINSIDQILNSTNARTSIIEKELNEKNEQFNEYKIKCDELVDKLKEQEEIRENTEIFLETARDDIKRLEELIAGCKAQIIELLNDRGSTKAKHQHFDTMLEQINIRKSELDKRFIEYKSEELEYNKKLDEFRKELEEATAGIVELNERDELLKNSIEETEEKIREKMSEINRLNNEYHRDKSKLDTLVNITERYDGYGNGIKKVMEQKDAQNGIVGVVADIIKVDKKYEVAIETALGGSIQNIVTRDENTAKSMIEFLKKNKFGRATFLPLSSISQKGTLKDNEILKEKGILGLASELVKVNDEYQAVAKYLLGRVVVADSIDNALIIARKYKYSTRIVTLEGESLSPGGSITGGSFKNSSNLLGRRREIEELKNNIESVKKKSSEYNADIEKYHKEKEELEKESISLKEKIRQQYILQNTAKMNVSKVEELAGEMTANYEKLNNENVQIQNQIDEIKDSKELIELEISMADKKNEELEADISKYEEELKAKDQIEREYNLKYAEKNIEYTTLEQNLNFEKQNMSRVEKEIEKLQEELDGIISTQEQNIQDIEEKKNEICRITKENESLIQTEKELKVKLETLQQSKEKMNTLHKTFFERRDEIANNVTNLEKEVLRLESTKEKLDILSENITNYIWDEYELTYHSALPFRNEELNNINDIKKNISELKDEIKSLGNVNVNAIEDYKQVSERYEFLKTQHDDLIESEKVLEGIIEQLDTGMRRQFNERFALIQIEFDKAFKELFGGGKGTLELVEGGDVLESGIKIIAQPPGKKLQNMMQLSGGEKSLTAISLLFAIQNLKPSPFCLLDEIEAALDDSNVLRFAKYLHKLTKNTQFIVITHRRGTMNSADRLYGITMQEKGVSTLVSVNLIQDELDKEEQLMKQL